MIAELLITLGLTLAFTLAFVIFSVSAMGDDHD